MYTSVASFSLFETHFKKDFAILAFIFLEFKKMDEYRSEKTSNVSKWQPQDEHYLQPIDNSLVKQDETIPVSNIINLCLLKFYQF